MECKLAFAEVEGAGFEDGCSTSVLDGVEVIRVEGTTDGSDWVDDSPDEPALYWEPTKMYRTGHAELGWKREPQVKHLKERLV